MGKKKSSKGGLGLIEETPVSATVEQENGATEEEEEYEVEKVVDKRIHKGKVEYLLKWKGYTSEDNTWETEDSLDCEELLQEYESRLEKQSIEIKKEKKEKRKGHGDKSESKTKKRKVAEPPSKEAEFDQKDVKEEKDEGEPNHDDDIDPLAEGWEAAEILGATDVEGQVHFLIRWKGSKRADLIPSPTANVRWPQIVIKFYEDRVTWTQNNENGES
ncbi:PREDICTED: chromobox protein homolog 1-like [Acropora digitifera]|uniref:chromobox protein homolog 1-like n=1 Tax=Acropora digitifera TaxID=70779 RepID=UPI00077AC13C|nr:PREDICTED: chromobox protein homolog 1-like [Acropora digitifera]